MKIEIKENFGIRGRVRRIVTKAGTDEVLRVGEWSKNMIVSGVNTGKNLIAQKLGGNNTYTLNVTHADIGKGTTAPTLSDTQLENAIARVAVIPPVINNNVVTFRFFFPDALLPNDTYTELGTYIDGLVGVNTGRILNRLLFSTPHIKGTGEDSTFEVEITI